MQLPATYTMGTSGQFISCGHIGGTNHFHLGSLSPSNVDLVHVQRRLQVLGSHVVQSGPLEWLMCVCNCPPVPAVAPACVSACSWLAVVRP